MRVALLFRVVMSLFSVRILINARISRVAFPPKYDYNYARLWKSRDYSATPNFEILWKILRPTRRAKGQVSWDLFFSFTSVFKFHFLDCSLSRHSIWKNLRKFSLNRTRDRYTILRSVTWVLTGFVSHRHIHVYDAFSWRLEFRAREVEPFKSSARIIGKIVLSVTTVSASEKERGAISAWLSSFWWHDTLSDTSFRRTFPPLPLLTWLCSPVTIQFKSLTQTQILWWTAVRAVCTTVSKGKKEREREKETEEVGGARST